MPSTSAKSNHISNFRAAYAKQLEAYDSMRSLVNEANDEGYTFVDGDFVGSNAGIPASDYNTALTQATNWTNAFATGVNVGGSVSTTLPFNLRGVFTKVAK